MRSFTSPPCWKRARATAASTAVAAMSEIRSRKKTPNIPTTGSESFLAISTGRMGSPGRPNKKRQVNPISVALYTFQKCVWPSDARKLHPAQSPNRVADVNRRHRQQQKRKICVANRLGYHAPIEVFQSAGMPEFIDDESEDNCRDQKA